MRKRSGDSCLQNACSKYTTLLVVCQVFEPYGLLTEILGQKKRPMIDILITGDVGGHPLLTLRPCEILVLHRAVVKFTPGRLSRLPLADLMSADSPRQTGAARGIFVVERLEGHTGG